MTGDPPTDESGLVGELAARHWLRGEVIQAAARARQLDRDRYKVSGLDANGQALAGSAPERAVEGTLALFTDDSPDGYVAVSGGHPRCAAVGLYQAARFDHAWLVITPHRLAVLRLRDVRNTHDGVVDAMVEQPGPDKSLGGFLRGVGKIVKTSTAEFVQGARRSPLVERPQDAVLECPFEIARQALHSIVRWKQPLVPQFRGGPRFVRVSFADGSWARLQTDEAGQRALTG